MARLKGKVCIITGAGSGIGQASARLFAKEGALVVVADIDLRAARATAAGIRKAGGEAVAEQVDVTDEAQTVALAGRVVKKFKRIDVLFNNAGISGVGDVQETKPDLFDRVMSVNVRGVYLMSRAVVPHMIKQRSGSIVNMSSCIAEIGLARRVSYAASKGAVLAMTKSMQVQRAAAGNDPHAVCRALSQGLVQRSRRGLCIHSQAAADQRAGQAGRRRLRGALPGVR